LEIFTIVNTINLIINQKDLLNVR